MLNRENVLKNTSIEMFNEFNLEEIPNIAKINIRGNSADKDFISNVEKNLDTLVPTEANTYNSNSKLKIVWLSPSEWLIEIYEKHNFEEILPNLKKSLNSLNTAITDTTENKTILRLSGKHLYKLLAKFMIIDLEKVMQKETSVAQTIFIKVPVLIIRNHNKKEEQSVDLHVNRSHAQYVVDLIKDGSQNINL